MNIFEKRPLSLILCIILGGFSLFAISGAIFRIILISIAIILLALPIIIKELRRIYYISCVGVFALSFLLSFVYFDFVFYPPSNNEEVSIVGEVINVEPSESYVELDIKCREIEGKRTNRKIKAYFYGEGEEVISGDIIRFTSKLECFESGNDFDFNKYYTARGFSAVTSFSDITVEEHKSPALSYKFAMMRLAICKRAIDLCDDDAAGLLCAGLLGEKSLLSGQVNLDFQRIGISHILAISGMHLAMLIGFFEFLLSAFKVGRKTRIAIECIFTLAYMTLTGFPLSVCRAGIMLIISSLLYLISGCKDSITSLFVSVMLIVIISPYSAVDIGLWLSAFATLGILIASELINDRYNEERGIKRFARAIVVSIMFSFFALCATSVISVLNFRLVSAISVISTLIFSITFEVFIYFGIATLIFGNLIPLVAILTLIASVIQNSSAWLSEMKLVCASTSFTSVKIIFICCFVIFILTLYKLYKNKALCFSVIALTFLICAYSSVLITSVAKNDDSITYYGEKSDIIIIKSDNKSALIDISQHKSANGYYDNSVIYDIGLTELDVFVIANYTPNLSESLPIVLSSVLVDRVLLPMPTDFNEEQIAKNAIAAIDEFRTEVEFYQDKNVITIGECGLCVSHRAEYADSLAITAMFDGEIYSYLSSGAIKDIPSSRELLFVSRSIVFGGYGSGYEDKVFIDEFGDRLRTLLVNDDSVYIDTYESQSYLDVNFGKERFVLYD